MSLSRLIMTTAQATIIGLIRQEVWTQCLHDIVNSVVRYNIPKKLIIDGDQTHSPHVSTENITMAEKNKKQVAWKEANGRYGRTVRLAELMSSEALSMQLITSS